MKLSTRDANRYFKNPEADRAGLLIYGADAMRVALKRQEVIAALVGPQGEEEMRLARMAASELRKDPAWLQDAMKAQSFFPGPRVVFLEEANDTVATVVADALQDWQPGDAQLVISAGALKASSKLRKLFESHKNAYAAAIYDNPPTRDDIEAELKRAALDQVNRAAMEDLTALSRELDPGDFRQTVEKIALYKLNDASPLSSEDVSACAPLSAEADVDDVLNVVAEARVGDIGATMRRLKAQGVTPVSLCIGATRHFRTLYAAASDPGGAAAGIARARPPVYGPRRDRMQRQAQAWGASNLETALDLLTETDLQLRSAGQHAPAMALMERTLVRLAKLAARQRA